MKEGWKYVKLGDCCHIIGGGTPDKKNDKYYNGDIPWATVRDMNVDNIESTDCSITEEGLKNSASHIIESGNVVIATRVGLGKVCLLNQDTAINQDLKGIVPKSKDSIIPLYIFYWFKSKANDIIKNGTGATVQGVKLKFISDLLFPILPLSEQHRIVSYLDTSFAQIDALAKQAEESLENAKALFQATLKELMEKKDGWEEKKFGDVCWYNKNNGLHKRTKYIGMEHIEQGTGRLLATICSDDVLSNTFAFSKGDVLYGRLRPYLKKVIVADFDGCCSTEIFPIQSKEILASFLMYWFLTDEITNKVNATCAGCRMPRGNMNDVLKFIISFPSKAEQQSIVQTLDTLSQHISQLQSNYTQTLANCQALKQALLRETFE